MTLDKEVLKCQINSFMLFPTGGVELSNQGIHSVTKSLWIPGKMLEMQVKDTHPYKCLKWSDWCSDVCMWMGVWQLSLSLLTWLGPDPVLQVEHTCLCPGTGIKQWLHWRKAAGATAWERFAGSPLLILSSTLCFLYIGGISSSLSQELF